MQVISMHENSGSRSMRQRCHFASILIWSMWPKSPAKAEAFRFCASTGFHGLDFIRPGQAWSERILWLICAFVGLCLALVLSWASLRGVLQGETVVDRKFQPPEDWTLPPIRICHPVTLGSLLSSSFDIGNLPYGPSIRHSWFQFIRSLWKTSTVVNGRETFHPNATEMARAVEKVVWFTGGLLPVKSMDLDLTNSPGYFVPTEWELGIAETKNLSGFMSENGVGDVHSLTVSALADWERPLVMGLFPSDGSVFAWSIRRSLRPSESSLCYQFQAKTPQMNRLNLLLAFRPAIIGDSYSDLTLPFDSFVMEAGESQHIAEVPKPSSRATFEKTFYIGSQTSTKLSRNGRECSVAEVDNKFCLERDIANSCNCVPANRLEWHWNQPQRLLQPTQSDKPVCNASTILLCYKSALQSGQFSAVSYK